MYVRLDGYRVTTLLIFLAPPVSQLTGESQWQQSEADGVYDAATEAYTSYGADHSQVDASSPHIRDLQWDDLANENSSAASVDDRDGTNGASKHKEDPAGLGMYVCAHFLIGE